MKLTDLTPVNFQDIVEQHVRHSVPLEDNPFRLLSSSWSQVFETARQLRTQGTQFDEQQQELLNSDIGTWAEYVGHMVPLDVPLYEELNHAVLTEAEYQGRKVELNQPHRGGAKKFYVYVRNPKTGNVKKISFGDTTGLSVKIRDPKRRASFAARHRCDTANDKMTARYWSCRLPRYAKSLGLSGGGTWW